MAIQAMVACLVLMQAAKEGQTPSIPAIDRIRLAEAFRLADAVGNDIWPGWDKAPFAVLLVAADHEFLVRHPKPSNDFRSLGEDPVLKQKVWIRKRHFPTSFLATFPVAGLTPTIVIGQAENTEARTSTPWVITVLHEHFHQLQYSQSDYYSGVNSLGLARGDQTGMWMLNFPFPYQRAEVIEQCSVLGKNLLAALQARGQPAFATEVAECVQARKKLHSLLQPDEIKYLNFQLWQEGVARYTEYRLAQRAAAAYRPGKDFQGLKDFSSYQKVAQGLIQSIEKEMAAIHLDKSKRTVVYNLGAAEALVLDEANPNWRTRYFAEPFSLDPHFPTKK